MLLSIMLMNNDGAELRLSPNISIDMFGGDGSVLLFPEEAMPWFGDVNDGPSETCVLRAAAVFGMGAPDNMPSAKAADWSGFISLEPSDLAIAMLLITPGRFEVAEAF